MDFFGTCIPEDIYDPLTGSSSYDGIIYKYYPFSFEDTLYGAELYPDGISSLILGGCYEASAHIFILNKSDLVGDSAFSSSTT